MGLVLMHRAVNGVLEGELVATDRELKVPVGRGGLDGAGIRAGARGCIARGSCGICYGGLVRRCYASAIRCLCLHAGAIYLESRKSARAIQDDRINPPGATDMFTTFSAGLTNSSSISSSNT
jgi:hypothetical protein